MATTDRASSSASPPRSSQPSSPSERGEAIPEDTLFVAVSRQVGESESVLLWSLENRGNSQICIIHVHQPDKEISVGIGLPVPIDQIPSTNQIEAHRVKERERLSKRLRKHLQFCSKRGVNARKIYIEMDSIQDGIVKLISDMKIGKLVMGGASDKRYSKDMIEILSEKAKYVRQHGPSYCHIWFVCNELLVHTRKATEKVGSSHPVNFEHIERLRPAHSYEIGGLLDVQSSFVGDRIRDEYEMPMLNRNFSHSTYHSSLSGPSAPELTFSHVVGVEQKGIDAWLLAQQTQHLYGFTPSSTLQSHISSLESRIEESGLMVEQLELRLESAMEEVEKYKKDRDDAIKQVEEVRHQLMEGTSYVDFPTFCYELPFQEIENATNKFDPLLKIGQDAYGNIYKGSLNLQVAVKVPRPSSSSSPQVFQQEVEIMSKVRHPNMVNLISICPESQALIYEYFENGNLEDQLNSKVEGSPLQWRTRTKIAVELCNVLMFLHSQKPLPIIHGDIRAENIHLDSKYTCKLYRTDSRASNYAYTDPEYFANDDLTTRSDVYSYGIILLRLLTGKPAVRLTRQVQMAVDTDELGSILDPSAGWPLDQAKQLTNLALRCCEMNRQKRLDLEPDVWNILETMKGSYD